MTLKEALLRKNDGCHESAQEDIRDMVDRVLNSDECPEEVLLDYGLEADYVFDLLDYCADSI